MGWVWEEDRDDGGGEEGVVVLELNRSPSHTIIIVAPTMKLTVMMVQLDLMIASYPSISYCDTQ